MVGDDANLKKKFGIHKSVLDSPTFVEEIGDLEDLKKIFPNHEIRVVDDGNDD